MRKRKRSGAYSVSLFPFLTVLISTMGALIVMLVIAVRNAEQRGQAEADLNREKLTAQIEEVQASMQLSGVRVKGWKERWDELTGKLRSARNSRTYLVSEFRDLEEKKAELVQQLVDLDSVSRSIESGSPTLTDLEAEVQQLQDDLATKHAMKGAAGTETVYSIVPFYGPNATQRRPIYVECRQDKLVIQPFGIELNAADFQQGIGPQNPFDAALSTIQQDWNERNSTDSENAPYPLLIVRPDGSAAYALARRAMVSWVDEFGYELVSADTKLEFGQVDEVLKQKIENAVREARQRSYAVALKKKELERTLLSQRVYVDNGTHSGEDGGGANRGSGSGGLEVDRVNGGFKTIGQSTNPNPLTTVPSPSEPIKSDLSPKGTSEISKTDSASSLNKGTNDSANQSNPQADESVQGVASEGGIGKLGTPGVPRLADQKGNGWAIPQSVGKSICYRRPIKIFCGAQELIVLPETNSGDQRIIIPINGITETCVSELVNEIQKRVNSWGPAAAAGYWKPMLELRVVPGGEGRFGDLSRLLDDSGLELNESQD